ALETSGQVADNTTIGSTVAERYASALFDLALSDKALPAVEADFDRFAALLNESADLERLFRSPVFSAEEQTRAVTAVLDKAEIGGRAGNPLQGAAGNRRPFSVP